MRTREVRSALTGNSSLQNIQLTPTETTFYLEAQRTVSKAKVLGIFRTGDEWSHVFFYLKGIVDLLKANALKLPFDAEKVLNYHVSRMPADQLVNNSYNNRAAADHDKLTIWLMEHMPDEIGMGKDDETAAEAAIRLLTDLTGKG